MLHKNVSDIPANISVASESFILDYAQTNDLQTLANFITHDEAMAQIYIDESNIGELEQVTTSSEHKNNYLPKSTVLLIKNNGKLYNYVDARYDFMLVLKNKSSVVGFIEFHLPVNPNEQTFEIFSLYVDKNYRRFGLGSILLQNALNFMLNSGQKTATLRPTSASLVIYNKFCFYPSQFDEDDQCNNPDFFKSWFQKSDTERLELIQDEYPALQLNLNLTKPHCAEYFKLHSLKCTSGTTKYIITDQLKLDLNKNMLQTISFFSLSNATPSSGPAFDKHYKRIQ